ncbi:hypothetical protein D3C73_1343550 [compost metagenome]
MKPGTSIPCQGAFNEILLVIIVSRFGEIGFYRFPIGYPASAKDRDKVAKILDSQGHDPSSGNTEVTCIIIIVFVTKRQRKGIFADRFIIV